MLKSKNHQDTREIHFHVNVPLLRAPKIARTTMIDGKRFYIGRNKKQYRADLYDKMFKVTKGEVLPWTYKGANHSEIKNLRWREKEELQIGNEED